MVDEQGPRWLSGADQRGWRALVVGTQVLMDRLDRDLRAEFDLSMPEYEVLVRLSEVPGRNMRMALLADSMSYSRSRVTHTVARMERAGLVTRSQAAHDGRGVVATMTDEGFAVIERAAPRHVEGVRNYLLDLCSPEDFAAVSRAFNAVCDTLLADEPPGADIR